MRIKLTNHAVERLVERWPSVDPNLFLTILYGARPTKKRTSAGDEVWANDGMEFVMRRDPDGSAACVTVLPPAPKQTVEPETDPWGAVAERPPGPSPHDKAVAECVLEIQKAEALVTETQEQLKAAQTEFSNASKALRRLRGQYNALLSAAPQELARRARPVSDNQ